MKSCGRSVNRTRGNRVGLHGGRKKKKIRSEKGWKRLVFLRRVEEEVTASGSFPWCKVRRAEAEGSKSRCVHSCRGLGSGSCRRSFQSLTPSVGTTAGQAGQVECQWDRLAARPGHCPKPLPLPCFLYWPTGRSATASLLLMLYAAAITSFQFAYCESHEITLFTKSAVAITVLVYGSSRYTIDCSWPLIV